MFLLIAFAVLSIGVSFLCSLLEAALLSMTPSYVAQVRETNPRLHAKLNDLKRNIDQPLAAILTLNTIAHTVGATGVGAQVTVVFGEAWLGIASALMTLLILFVSEIIPKTIGATYWRQLSGMLAATLKVMVWSLKPFIWMSEQITRRIGKGAMDTDMRGEIKALAQIGQEEKALDPEETRVIVNILNLHDITVRSVMTPRTVSVTARAGMTLKEFDETCGTSPFTRFPVMDGGEQALGYIHRADTYNAEDDVDLKTLMHSGQDGAGRGERRTGVHGDGAGSPAPVRGLRRPRHLDGPDHPGGRHRDHPRPGDRRRDRQRRQPAQVRPPALDQVAQEGGRQKAGRAGRVAQPSPGPGWSGISQPGTQRRKASMPNSSTSDWKTMTTTAACQPWGSARAMGSITKEVRGCRG